jgi:hypothetical protein
LIGFWGLSPGGLAAAKTTIGASVEIVITLRDAAARMPAFANSSAGNPDFAAALASNQAATML